MTKRDSEKGLTSLAGLIVAMSKKKIKKVYEILMEEVYNLSGKYYQGLKRRRLDECEICLGINYKREKDLEREIP